MNDGKCGAPFARTPEFNKRRLLRHANRGGTRRRACLS
jgi:hypothetical protein